MDDVDGGTRIIEIDCERGGIRKCSGGLNLGSFSL